MKNKILVAIPAYNCEKQVPRVLEGFQSKDLQAKITEVIVVDNRSPDGTFNAAKQAIEKFGLGNFVRVIKNKENYGLGGTHKVAFNYGIKNGYDYVAILHGDNQAKTEELTELIELAEKNPEAAAVLGARFHPSSRLKGYSKTRTVGNLALNTLYTCVALRKTFDLGSGLNVFRVKDLDPKRFCKFTDSFTFNIDLLLNYYKENSQLIFHPITWSETDQVSNAKAIKVGLTTVKTLLFWKMNRPVLSNKSDADYQFE